MHGVANFNGLASLARRDADHSVWAGADRQFALSAGRDAYAAAEHLVVGAPPARHAKGTVAADEAAVATDRTRALAAVAKFVDPGSASKRWSALATKVSRSVGDHAFEPITVRPAPVLVQKRAAVAPGAVLPVLSSAVVAGLAWGDGGVVVTGALAPVAHRRDHLEPATAA